MSLTKYVGWTHKVTFSAYVALLVVLEEGSKEGSQFLSRLGYPLFGLYRLAAYLLHLPDFSPSRQTHFCLLWWLLTMIVLLGLAGLGRLSFAKTFLNRVAGCIIVAGIPWLRLFGYNGLSWDHLSPIVRTLLTVDATVIIACALTYSYRRWPTFLVWCVLLTAHLVFWDWATWIGLTDLLSVFYLILPLGSGLIWGLYIKRLASS